MYAEYDLAPHLYGSRAYAPYDPWDRITAAAEQGDARALAFGGARFFSPEIYLKNAERGNVFAMCELSNLYEYGFEDGIGTNFPKDEDKAKQWQWKAFDTALKHLEEGDGTDFDTYFRRFGAGKGVRVFSDYEEAEKTALAKRILDALLNEKQDRNCSLALYAGLRMAFEEEGFIEKQDREAFLRDLAKQYVYEMALADYLLEDGRNEAEKAEGAEILRICAGMGDDDARLELAKLYLDGEGVKEDKAEAVRWLRLAAGQRNLEAMFLLSVVLRTPDRPHSRIEADEWEWKAEKDGEFDSRPEYWYWLAGNELQQLLERGIRAVGRAFR
jgi:TPR repeat protein